MMKKLIAALAALMMALLCITAIAEETAAASGSDPRTLFDSAWVSGSSQVKAWYMDGYWEVQVSADYGATIWDYTCVYDEEQNALVSDDSAVNVKSVISMDEEGSEADRIVVDEEAKAVFTVDEDGLLRWQDAREDAGAGIGFEKIGWFEGDFICGDYFLSCMWTDLSGLEDGETFVGYTLTIDLLSDDSGIYWTYRCEYNADDNTLTAIGSKEIPAEDGEALEIVYDDGEAVFSFDEEGNILWQDKVEHTGDDLMFIQTNG